MASTGVPWAWSLQTPSRYPQDPPRDLKTSDEWNKTSARKQVWTPHIWAPPLQKESLPEESTLNTETQERARPPGLLIEANIITWGTSSNQRHLQQLTPEIARWWKANIRILLTKTKTLTIIRTQNSHFAQSKAPQHTRKATPGFKSISHDDGRGHQEDLNKSLKEIQENTAKQVEDLKEETQKSLKELQENTTRQVMELNKTIQKGSRPNKENPKWGNSGDRNPRKKSGTIDVSISNRIQQMEERNSGAEDSIENIGTTITENTKCKKILSPNIQEIQDTMRRPNFWIIGVDENEDFQLKGPANIFNKIIEENFPNLKKDMPMNIK
jgi:hypothetical protein